MKKNTVFIDSKTGQMDVALEYNEDTMTITGVANNYDDVGLITNLNIDEVMLTAKCNYKKGRLTVKIGKYSEVYDGANLDNISTLLRIAAADYQKVPKQSITLAPTPIVEHPAMFEQPKEIATISEAKTDLVTISAIDAKFVAVAGKISSINEDINSASKLAGMKEFEAAFNNIETDLKALMQIEPASGWSKFFGKTPEPTRTPQEAIDQVFGVVEEKYEELVVTSGQFQKAKQQIAVQVDILKQVEEESNAEVAQYETQSDVPSSILSTNTKIMASVLEHERKIQKIDGIVLATQASIITLGGDLPTMKARIIDDMALGNLLVNLDDFHKSFVAVTELTATLSALVGDKTHQVTENLFNIQINDNSKIDRIIDDEKRADKYSNMVVNSSQKLRDKHIYEAEVIKEKRAGIALSAPTKQEALGMPMTPPSAE